MYLLDTHSLFPRDSIHEAESMQSCRGLTSFTLGLGLSSV